MDISNGDSVEFLDFTGVEEAEKERVLSSLHSTTSSLPLPWIITQNIPSSHSKIRYNDIKKRGSVERNDINPDFRISHNSFAPHNIIPHSFDQAQYQPVALNITTKFPLPQQLPYNLPYPQAVIPIPPIYNNFHHSPQGLTSNNSSTMIKPVICSTEPYSYSQVSPAPASFDNPPQYSHGYIPNPCTTSPSHYDHNGTASTLLVGRVPPPIENMPPQVSFENIPSQSSVIVPNSVDDANSNTQVNSNTNVNNDVNVQKVLPVEKSAYPSSSVSYGVPNSSPFPANKEIKPVYPSPAVDKTEYKKNEDSLTTNQNGVTTNGYNSVRSWASLFNKGSSIAVSNNGSKMDNSITEENKDMESNQKSSPIKHSRKSQFIDPTCYRMGEYLLSHTVDGKTISLQPRGLINRSNYCYINSILQALLACPPLYNLLSGLSKNIVSNEKRKPTPVIDSMCKLINEFEHLPAGQRVGRRTDKNQKKEAGVLINCGNPFEPAWIYKMLNGMRSDSFLIEGRQEDAEEFFGCLLNGLNDEIQELMKLVANDSTENTTELIPSSDQESEDWQVMGPKNKGSVTRKTVFGRTPISNIFGGLLRSKIHRAGDESTNNIQPFFTLQLNIEKAKTVSEALEALVSKNQLEGVTSSKTNEQVEAWQQVMIEELPVVLVLHLKCFDYQLNSCTKIMKTLEFPIDLKIDSKLLSSKMNSSKEKQYKLFAVVYHDGKEASKGHYLTDAFHVGYNSWLRYDDASVKAVSEEQVLSPQGCRVPYLLFYRRSDTIRSK
ncbi:hypothetical protein HHI36_019231 [Cryptolaemus montrouzieri]|uniref:ubiquitinyl hydrolase 1 n=1 Tax=Cryptolaemus montrouzieri TaxID=559131 RepID=A0ABD2P2U5_9CUCU